MACWQEGTYNSTRIIENKYHNLLAMIRNIKTEQELLNLLSKMGNFLFMSPKSMKFGKNADFAYLLENPSNKVSVDAVLSLAKLLKSEDDEVKQACVEGIMFIKQINGLEYLAPYMDDLVIAEVINKYQFDYE